MKVAEVIAAGLARHGVEVLFGQSIPPQIHLATPAFGIRSITYRTENAGGAMADGYARVRGRLGVVTAQNGPAATLLVPPLAEALKASVPVLAIVQDVPRAAAERNAFQELDQLALFSGCAKWVRRVEVAERVADFLDLAVIAATSGRPGPAVLLIPVDLFAEDVNGEGRTAALGAFPLDRTRPTDDALHAAARALATARQPLVLAGGGVHLSGACQALAALQDTASLPVATTSMGKGAVDERHPLSLGVVGYYMGRMSRTRHLRQFVQDSDVILLVGTRTNHNATDAWTLLPRGARYLHVDVDGQELGRNYEVLRLPGDAQATLAALLDALRQQDLSRRSDERARLEARIAEAHDRYRAEAAPLLRSAARPLRPERLMTEIQRRLSPDAIVAGDASYASVWIGNYLESLAPGMRFLTPRGLAGLGWGLPLAIGAKLARPNSPVVCIVGDGGFGHVWSELETMVRSRVSFPIVVLNNQILGFQKHGEETMFGAHTDAVHFAPVDHAAIARACGANGVRIDDPEAFGPALEQALTADRPTVLDVVTDPDAYPPIGVFDARDPGARGAIWAL
jgi:acetolactate synthase-1/2/3 large subunit